MPSHIDQKAAEARGVSGNIVENTANIKGDCKIYAMRSFKASMQRSTYMSNGTPLIWVEAMLKQIDTLFYWAVSLSVISLWRPSEKGVPTDNVYSLSMESLIGSYPSAIRVAESKTESNAEPTSTRRRHKTIPEARKLKWRTPCS